MADDAESAESQNPGAQYNLYIQNEEIVDKLKLLNYEADFVRISPSYKSIERHYFVRSTNTGEQFHLFTSVAAWLISKTGVRFDYPQEFDDPNLTIGKILAALKEKDIAADISPSKLKNGSGDQCLYVLDKLTELALETAEFSWRRTEPILDEAEDDEQIETNEAEITAEQYEDEDPMMAEDDDDMNGFNEPGIFDSDAPESAQMAPVLQEIIQSDVDKNQWKEEVDRVTPQLKITVRQDAKDWRMHINQMKTLCESLKSQHSKTIPFLNGLSTEIDKSTERITSRERHLNDQLDGLLTKYRAAQDRLAEINQKYKEASGGVNQRTERLQQIGNDIDQIKLEIEEQGQKNIDGAPIIRVKQALAKMENDLKVMDIQASVIDQMLMQAQLNNRINLSTDIFS
ncbi:hypothetical protein L596_008828 [Steinernema carpocapsae]|uniref:Intraflagellar transport protein 57 homolog n=1 Tax=Steinernema carpocapsae TaxID=34508 RepID=A0A4U5PEF9_STECR|nr:hypothetical protein L596_008828 [Steinernema carpocapsae]